MARTDRTRRVDRTEVAQYRSTARSFLVAAEALDALASEDETYGAAIGLLAIHVCISYADTVSIAYAGLKSTGAHEQAESLLVSVLGQRFPKVQRTRLLRVLSQKDAVAYQGRYYALSEARKQLAAAKVFATWAERMFEQRP